jgi:hypothetical protein
MCEALEDFDGVYYANANLGEYEGSRFLSSYKFYDDSVGVKLIKLLYYSCTSLTTIGLGDFHPKADLERVVCAFLILFGVMLFSFISSNLIVILQNFRDYMQPVGDADKLNKFIFTLYKFNDSHPLDKKFE